MAFVGIDRGIVDHWIYQDAEYFKVWFEIIHRTRFGKEPKKKLVDGVLVTVEYGQFMFGRISWSQRLNVSERRLRTLMDKLIKDNMISLVEKYTKLTVYQVVNYELYHKDKSDQQNDQQQDQSEQGISDISDQQNDLPATSKRPASDQQATTKEQGKELKQGNKDKEIKEKHMFNDYTSNPELIETLKSFIEFRKKIKSPMTDRAIELFLGNLDKLSNSDSEKIEIMNQSIINGWKSVYALKEETNGGYKKTQGTGLKLHQTNSGKTEKSGALPSKFFNPEMLKVHGQ